MDKEQELFEKVVEVTKETIRSFGDQFDGEPIVLTAMMSVIMQEVVKQSPCKHAMLNFIATGLSFGAIDKDHSCDHSYDDDC